jgi:hypothetical protein
MIIADPDCRVPSKGPKELELEVELDHSPGSIQ